MRTLWDTKFIFRLFLGGKMEKICIYDYQKDYNHYTRKLKKLEVSEKNSKLIFRFIDVCSLNNMSKARIIRYLRFFTVLFGISNKELEKVTKEDIEKIISVINANENSSPSTKHDFKVMLKRFYKWFKGNDEEYPPEVKWIKSNIKRTEKKLVGDGELITQEDVNKLIGASEYSRDKALVSLLYESGCRIGEIGSIRIGNVSFDKYGTVISVNGKTGPRKIRVVSSTPYLRTWLNAHPFGEARDKPLWVKFGARNHNEAMDYVTFRIVVARLFKKAKINKRHNLHLFRHSRATYMANYLTEFQMNQYFGWIQGSDMPSTYVHLSGKETDKAILEMNGLQQKSEIGEKAKVTVCPRCDFINNTGATYCNKCAFVLDERVAVKLEMKKKEESQMTNISKELIAKLLKQPEVMDMLLEKINEIQEQ